VNEQSIRFGITDGISKRASTWKCWTHTGTGKSDVYLTHRSLGGVLKASLHQSGAWHIAFSEEYYHENRDALIGSQSSRFIDKWRPSEIANGITLAFRILTPHSAVSIPIVSLDNDIFWIPAPATGDAVEVDILITAPNILISSWPGKNSMNTELINSMLLDSGETTWVVYRVIDFPDLGNLKGEPVFFKGKNKDDLATEGLRIIVFGSEHDGSRIIIDSCLQKMV